MSEFADVVMSVRCAECEEYLEFEYTTIEKNEADEKPCMEIEVTVEPCKCKSEGQTPTLKELVFYNK